MTDETKKHFFAPWTVKHHVHACWEVDFEVSTTNGMSVAVSPTEEHAARLASLPELYDALLDEIRAKCNTCIHDNIRLGRVPFINHFNTIQSGCPFKDRQCHTVKHIEIIQKVRDGE